MQLAADYIRQAEAAEAKAETLSDVILRQGFLDLARQWRAMAHQTSYAGIDADRPGTVEP